MAEAKAVMPPPGGSAAGRGLKAVLWAGVFGAVGGVVGGLVAGPAGAVVGASVGAGAALLAFGAGKGFQDKKMWNHYQWQRYNHAKETGELLPNLEVGRHRMKRRVKNVVGLGLVGGALVLAGLGPAMTAVPALAFWGAAVGGAYMLTKLVTRFRRPDFKGLAASMAAEEAPEAPEAEEPPPPERARNQNLPKSLGQARETRTQYARRPGGGQIAA